MRGKNRARKTLWEEASRCVRTADTLLSRACTWQPAERQACLWLRRAEQPCEDPGSSRNIVLSGEGRLSLYVSLELV